MPTFLDDFRERWNGLCRQQKDNGNPFSTSLDSRLEDRKTKMAYELLGLLAVADRADFPQDLIDAAKIVCGKESG